MALGAMACGALSHHWYQDAKIPLKHQKVARSGVTYTSWWYIIDDSYIDDDDDDDDDVDDDDDDDLC